MEPYPHDSDNLSELERRLSGWEPAADGLDADALLFAAGRASVRAGPARVVWPALTGLLSVLSVVLGVWLAAERGERLALTQQLRQQPTPFVQSSPASDADAAPPESPTVDEPPPDSYLAGRRALEKGLDAWPVRVVAHAHPLAPEPDILRLGQRNVLLDP